MSRFLDDRSGQYSGYFLDKESVSNVRAIIKGLVLGDLGEVTPRCLQEFYRFRLGSCAVCLRTTCCHCDMLVFMVSTSHYMGRSDDLVVVSFQENRSVASIPAVIIYCLLVGARVPAIRSTIMGLVVAAAILMDRKWHSLQFLGSGRHHNFVFIPALVLHY